MAPLLAEIAACEGRLAELLEGAASVLDARSGVGDADEGDVLARCAGFRDGVRAVQAELKALVARTAPGVPVDSDVYAARHRAQLQEQRISDIMAHVQGIERALS